MKAQQASYKMEAGSLCKERRFSKIGFASVADIAVLIADEEQHRLTRAARIRPQPPGQTVGVLWKYGTASSATSGGDAALFTRFPVTRRNALDSGQ
jgi:hypothetical protein